MHLAAGLREDGFVRVIVGERLINLDEESSSLSNVSGRHRHKCRGYTIRPTESTSSSIG